MSYRVKKRATTAPRAVHDADRARVVGGARGVALAGARPRDALDVGVGELATERGRARLERRSDVGAGHDQARLAEHLRVDVGRGLLDVVTEPLAKPRGRARRFGALRIHRLAVPGASRDGDPQASGVAADLLDEGTHGWRRPVRIADVGAGRRVEQRGAVAHRPGHRVTHRGAAPSFAGIGPHGVARARRLEAKEPAGGRGNPNRPSAVGGMRHWRHARGHCRCRSAARSPGAMGEVPGILRRAEQARLGGAGQSHLGRIGLAEDDEPGALEPRGDLAVVIDHEILEQRAAEARDRALVVRAQILQEIGHARERAGG